MTPPSRWCLGVAALALMMTAGLTLLGSSVTRSAGPEDRPAPVPAPRVASAPSGASVLPPSGSPAGDEIAAVAAGLALGRRHASMEASLRPLLVRPALRAGVFGLDLGSGAFFDLAGDQ